MIRVALISAAALLVLSQSAQADDAADALVARAIELRQAGNQTDALELLRRAHGLAPSPRTAGHLGLTEASLQLWADAYAHLTTALDANDPWVDRNRELLLRGLTTVQPHIAILTFAGPAGALVSVNGREVGALPIAKPVPVAEGPVDITATAPGYKPFAMQAVAKGGAPLATTISLAPVALAAPAASSDDAPPEPFADLRQESAPRPRTRLWTGSALAVGGAAGLALGITWIAFDGDGTCSAGLCPRVYDTATRGWLTAGIGAAALVSGTYLVISHLRRDTREQGQALLLLPNGIRAVF